MKSKEELKISNIDYITFENGIPNANYLKTLYENPKLAVTNKGYPYIDISEEFPKYFGSDISEEDAKVYLCLSYIRYIYYKEKEGLFQKSLLIEALNLEYQSTLHKQIYPEMLSLYRMILESKKYKKRGDKLTITYKQDKIDIQIQLIELTFWKEARCFFFVLPTIWHIWCQAEMRFITKIQVNVS